MQSVCVKCLHRFVESALHYSVLELFYSLFGTVPYLVIKTTKIITQSGIYRQFWDISLGYVLY